MCYQSFTSPNMTLFLITVVDSLKNMIRCDSLENGCTTPLKHLVTIEIRFLN